MDMDLGKFLKSPEYEIKITTYRDIFQMEALEYDRFGAEYRNHSAVVVLGRDDLKRMSLKPGDRVRLANNCGSVVVDYNRSSIIRISRQQSPKQPLQVYISLAPLAGF